MSSCQGELPIEEFQVKVTDQNGDILFNKSIVTLQNGFFELWLPRERKVEVSILGKGGKVIGKLETFDGSDTCVTSLQLR
jgi:hypothetical protein